MKKEISCENCFCIYSKKDQCMLNSIKLDSVGSCQSMILIDIDEKYLSEQKQKIFRRLTENYS